MFALRRSTEEELPAHPRRTPVCSHAYRISSGGPIVRITEAVHEPKDREHLPDAGQRRGRRYARTGRVARRNERICRTATGMRSFGSFQGNMLTSAFGASIAHSIATYMGA